MIILGLNAYHADASACLLRDGCLLAAAEEERFRRIKHWAGFPAEAIQYCLKQAEVEAKDLDHVAINRDPRANLLKKVLFAFGQRPSLGAVRDRLKNASRVRDIKSVLGEALGVSREGIKAEIHHIEHHRAHLGSTFYVSPFESAALASVDGFGDFLSTMVGVGEGSKFDVQGSMTFPHSLGLFYLAMTQYLGFPKYGDEYKVMGLAAYGKPEYLESMRRIVQLKPKGSFELDLDFFLHHSEGVSMTWDDGEPVIGRVYSDQLVRLLGQPREPGGKVTERHQNLAASMQAMYEEAFFHILNNLYDRTKQKNLCLAGGCALNSVANGQITIRTPFERVYIPPAAGDDGGAIGAAYSVWHEILGKPRCFVMDRADWGPSYDSAACRSALEERGLRLGDNLVAPAPERQASVLQPPTSGTHVFVRAINDEQELCRETAKLISEGKIVGWFQGRMEWGARALGHRSIVVDPRRPEMKEILNARIKRREPFRPFAPSILEEALEDYFEVPSPPHPPFPPHPSLSPKGEREKSVTHVPGCTRGEVREGSGQGRGEWMNCSPFMTMTYRVQADKRDVIPAPTHVDGTGRLQTVSRRTQPLYWQLIKEFENITGVPVVLNTSFNENEPIVCTPLEALDCFLRTKMDVLAIGPFLIRRQAER